MTQQELRELLLEPVPFEFAGSEGFGSTTKYTWKDHRGSLEDMAYSMRYALESEREKKLGINGEVRFFHNGRYSDPWTAAILLWSNRNNTFRARLLGFNNEGKTVEQLGNTGPHLGKRVWITDLPETAQLLALEEVLRVKGADRATKRG